MDPTCAYCDVTSSLRCSLRSSLSAAAEVASQHAEHISIDSDRAQELGRELAGKADEVKAAVNARLAFPVKFEGQEGEVRW